MASSILNANLDRSSTRVPEDRLIEDQADSGLYRARIVSRRKHWTFNLVWRYRPREDVDAAELFWRNIYERSFDYIWPLDGKVYRCNFTNAPQSRQLVYGFWEISIVLIGRPKS